ncbi:putative U3 small nucleolar RNA-associated protein 7 [Tieghemiomyces parasiticus]|uniref:U three protein 7 n=1 Tax=Tieghemiomyces parasiticus TaxID=78921 RepID=A0A9W8DZU6_9FUNG|nr:putative U3 small nucleolar RNA-associated protein 7 [Tieghemiomyces parasiticus]
MKKKSAPKAKKNALLEAQKKDAKERIKARRATEAEVFGSISSLTDGQPDKKRGKRSGQTTKADDDDEPAYDWGSKTALSLNKKQSLLVAGADADESAHPITRSRRAYDRLLGLQKAGLVPSPTVAATDDDQASKAAKRLSRRLNQRLTTVGSDEEDEEKNDGANQEPSGAADRPVPQLPTAKYARPLRTKLGALRPLESKEAFPRLIGRDAQTLEIHALRAEAASSAAMADRLLSESDGFITTEAGNERTYNLTQEALREMVDINTAAKMYNLELPLQGPYKVDYSRSGQKLIIGGRKGHIGTFNWQTGTLQAEVQLGETVRDVHWLHDEGMFAVAQKTFVYIYDGSGAEVHCLQTHKHANVLEYLPHHYLLASATEQSNLVYQDISIGKVVANHKVRMGPLHSMVQNPWNAVLNLGHSRGTVTMWTPNHAFPMVKMFCHRGPIQDLAVDPSGRYLVTAGADHYIRYFDIRTYKSLGEIRSRESPTALAVSQRGLVAVGAGDRVTVWKDLFRTAPTEGVTDDDEAVPRTSGQLYMRHQTHGSHVTDVSFCPYEDVLGVGHRGGFSSLVIPGSGEPNFDSMVPNPYMNRAQRREMEVRSLLDKLDPDMIVLDPTQFAAASRAKPDDTEEQFEKAINGAAMTTRKLHAFRRNYGSQGDGDGETSGAAGEGNDGDDDDQALDLTDQMIDGVGTNAKAQKKHKVFEHVPTFNPNTKRKRGARAVNASTDGLRMMLDFEKKREDRQKRHDRSFERAKERVDKRMEDDVRWEQPGAKTLSRFYKEKFKFNENRKIQ